MSESYLKRLIMKTIFNPGVIFSRISYSLMSFIHFKILSKAISQQQSIDRSPL